MNGIRNARVGELPELTVLPGDVFVAEREGKVVGHVAVRVIEGLAWITDLHCWATDATVTAQLCSRARRAVQDQGFKEYRLQIDARNPLLLDSLINKGHVMESVVLMGRIN